MSYSDLVLADSPIIYWRLEEVSGSFVNSGSLGGTVSNGTGLTRNQPGIPGGGGVSVLFNNSTTGQSYVKQNLSRTYINGSYTVEMWIKTAKTDQTLWMYPVDPYAYGSVTNAGLPNFQHIDVGGNLAGTTVVTDNKWHHLVMTIDGSTKQAKLYVDGALEATGTRPSTAFTTDSVINISEIRVNSFAMNGNADEFAFYNYVMSPTTISAHYAAGEFITGGPMTASTMMVDPAVSARGNILNPTSTYTYDGGRTGAMVVDRHDDPAISHTVKETLNKTALFGGQNLTVDSATLHLFADGTSSAGGTLGTRRYGTSDDTVTTVSTDGQEPNQEYIFDVTSIIQYANDHAIDAVIEIYGVVGTIYLWNDTGGAYRPYVEVKAHAAPVAVNPVASPATASASMANASVRIVDDISVAAVAGTATAAMTDAIVSAGTDAGIIATSMTSDALLVDPTVSTVDNIEVAVDAATADVSMPGGIFSNPVIEFAGPATASVTIVDASVTLTEGVIYLPEPSTAKADLAVPQVNGAPIPENEDEDPYFTRVYNLAPEIWWRLNDQGSTAVNRMSTSNSYNGVYDGVQDGRQDGPAGRYCVHFDGDAVIREIEPNDETTFYTGDTAQTTIEFHFRTTNADTFLMAGRDATESTTFASASEGGATELFLSDGNLGLRNYRFPDSLGNEMPPVEVTGFRNVADGEWHSVSIRTIRDPYVDGYSVEFYIDGTFERRSHNINPIVGFPDWIGSRPDTIDYQNLGVLPSSMNFVGDMSEIAFYTYGMSDTDIARNHYAFMGWAPIEAEPGAVSALMTDGNHGRGNQKRALFLYWNNHFHGGILNGMLSHHTGGLDPYVYATVTDYAGYKVFVKSMQLNDTGNSYFDEVYDDPTLIDLDRDVDLNDYDAIFVNDWPETGDDFDKIAAFYVAGSLDRLIGQFKEAVIGGKSLFVQNRRLAIDLGIIDRIEEVNLQYERAFVDGQGRASGLYDYGSAVKFPWDIVSSDGLAGSLRAGGATGTGLPENTDPDFLATKAFYYEDYNFINRFRVRAVIEGLTDIGSYMKADEVYHVDSDEWGNEGVAYKYLNRENGLLIGDEFMMQGYDRTGNNGYGLGDLFASAVPPENVLVGTPVTTFGTTYWQGKSIVANPYADYATTIAVQPGDKLDGQPIAGKIWVSFTEDTNSLYWGTAAAVQKLPADDNDVQWPNGYLPETPEQREWDYSWTRTSESDQTGTSLTTVYTTDAGGNLVATVTSNTWAASSFWQLFAVEWRPIMSITDRGLLWLATNEETVDGDVRIRPAAITAIAEMPAPDTMAQHSVTINVETMIGLGQMLRVAEDTEGDSQILTLAMTARATIVDPGKTIYAVPMTATATIVENFDMVHATGEHVVLTLHGIDDTLFIKEDA